MIEGFEQSGIARHIAAVAEIGIEIDEVHHQEAAVFQLRHLPLVVVISTPCLRL